MMRSLWVGAQDNPVLFRKINGWLTVLWLLAAIPICVFLSHSVSFLVFVSVYAVVTGHLSTWQAARVESKQQAEAIRRDDDAPGRIEQKVDTLHEKVDRRDVIG